MDVQALQEVFSNEQLLSLVLTLREVSREVKNSAMR